MQNEKTQFSQAALRAAQGFKTDARYARNAEIVTINPEDQTEYEFLQRLKVNPRTAEAVTVLLAPPGRPVATLTGAVTKDQIVARLTAAQSSGCPSGKCGPGGCGPKKQEANR